MERISSRVVYENPWMTVREDAVRRADGSAGIYGVVEKPDFALVLPRRRDGFWMVEQFRYPVGRRAWEFPQGSWGRGGGGDREVSEQDMVHRAFTDDEITGLIRGGGIVDAPSLAALTLYRLATDG